MNGFAVKFHFITMQGIKNFTGKEADEMRGIDPESGTKGIWWKPLTGKTFPNGHLKFS